MSSEEQKQILKMVEDGKISAEEAMTLIKALEESPNGDEIEVIDGIAIGLPEAHGGSHRVEQLVVRHPSRVDVDTGSQKSLRAACQNVGQVVDRMRRTVRQVVDPCADAFVEERPRVGRVGRKTVEQPLE